MLLPGVALPAAASDPAALLAADAQWREALVRLDRAVLDKVLAREYTLTTAIGVTPREAWLTSAASWKTRTIEWRTPPQVDLHGETAVVRGTIRWHVIKDQPDPRTGSAEVDSDFLITDVWIRRAGPWQVVARHSTIPVQR